MNRAKLRYYLMLFVKLGTLLLLVFWIFTLVWIWIYRNNVVKTTPQMVTYHFAKKNDSIENKVRHLWVSIDSISQNLVMAVLSTQDPDFFVHDGFALKDSSEKANNQNFLKRETISQRTSNAVFLMNGKTWIHRINQTYYTIMIEKFWGKRRILEVYLNSALMGDGVFGAEAASETYFHKKAGDLTQEEAASIALVMNNPREIDIQQLPDTLVAKRNCILEDMSMMVNMKIGKTPIDKEIDRGKPKHINRHEWKG